MPTAIRKPAKYIAELFKIIKYDPRTALADDDIFSRVNHVFYFSVAKHPASDNYWLTWGGWFDNPIIATSYGLQIFMDVFLIEVFNTTNLLSIINSFYVDVANNKVYMHLPINPFRYFAE
ncbi:MAG: hypothetical protein ABFD79_04745, partial [Phycisphaerales bacterium]